MNRQLQVNIFASAHVNSAAMVSGKAPATISVEMGLVAAAAH